MLPENKSIMRKTAGLPDTGSITDPNLRLFLDRIKDRFSELENKISYYESDEFVNSIISKFLNDQNFQKQLKNIINNEITIENQETNGSSGKKNNKTNIYIDSSLSNLIGKIGNNYSITLIANAPVDEEKIYILGSSGGSLQWIEAGEC